MTNEHTDPSSSQRPSSGAGNGHPEGGPPYSGVGVLSRGREPAFIVELESFSGPLDLLLYLIRRDEIDITDIPISRVADQFLATVHQLGLNEAADYLEMAARLLRIKAQMLLPRRFGDDDWEDPRYELVRRLLEYEQIREAADWLVGFARERGTMLSRGYLPAPPAAPPPPLRLELQDVVQAVEELLASIPEPVLHRVVPRPLDLEGAMAKLDQMLASRPHLTWADLIGPRPTIVDVLSMLIAVLEYARQHKLAVTQDAPFEPMRIVRGPTDAAH